MIPDSFWPWPAQYEVPGGTRQASYDISKVLERGALAPYLMGVEGNVAEFIVLQAREWGVNPWWAIISAQREQSAIEQRLISTQAMNAVMGYVGLDSGRVALPGYYGVFPQIYRSISQISWYMNQRVDGRKGKSTARWVPGINLPVKEGDAVTDPWVRRFPKSMSEFCQLSYTPHLPVLQENEDLVRKYCPQFL